MKLLASALAVLLLTACASTKQEAYLAGSADAATTAVGLASGFAEANPLGAVGAIAVKVVTIEVCDKAAQPAKTNCHHASSAVSWGAAASNAALLLGASTAGGLVLMVAAAAVSWNQGADEREFMRTCHYLFTVRDGKQPGTFTCKYR